MRLKDINHIVFSSDVENTGIVEEIKKLGNHTYIFKDARSAVYAATGIAAQNMETVLVCVCGSNASRSAFSGMTEAFYRKLPVILVTLGGSLDYSRELKDVVVNHFKISDVKEIENIRIYDMPLHLEITGDEVYIKKEKCDRTLKLLAEELSEKDYLYLGSNINYSDFEYNCKVVCGGMPNCYEGALSNVLGASLTKRHERYIGLVSEEEFIHDMNTLGNININDSIMYVVICDKCTLSLLDYAKSLGFETDCYLESELKSTDIVRHVTSLKKTVMAIYKENK